MTNVLNIPEMSIDVTHWKGIQDFKDASAIEESCAPCNMHVYPPQYLMGCTVLLTTVGLGTLVTTVWVFTEREAGVDSL